MKKVCILFILLAFTVSSFAKELPLKPKIKQPKIKKKVKAAQPKVKKLPFKFKDIPLNHWAVKAISQLYADGIVVGFPGSFNFKGDKPLTRYEMAALTKRIIDQVHTRTNLNRKYIEVTRKLLEEFQEDFSYLGVEVKSLKEKMETLYKKFEDIESLNEVLMQETKKATKTSTTAYKVAKSANKRSKSNKVFLILELLAIAALAAKVY